MRRVWAIAASLTWLGCRFSGPPPATGDDGDDGPANPAPDASADAVPDAYVPACMTDPSYSNNGPHRYKAYAQGTDYDTAIDRCAADGAHLVVVDSMVENEYLRTLITNDAWIGLDDLTTEGTFRWVTGATSAFRRFIGTEPNNAGGEDCTYLRDDGTWNDTGCEDSKRPLCECDPTYRPPPMPLCRTLANGHETRNGRRYFPRTTPATWGAAEADCQAIGAHLVTIGDADENDDLDLRFFGPYWIGYTDAVTEGQFQWNDGSPSTFHRWVAGAPNNDGQDCTVLQDFGSWADQPCGDMHPYVCECAPAPP